MKQTQQLTLNLFIIFFSLCTAGEMNAGAAMAPRPQQEQQMSVHDMFKDIPQDELLQMMEEGQQFIKYLEEHGTEEDKLMFAQAMEETLKGFTPEDWQEFDEIVKVVEDKLPPLVIEPKPLPKEIKQEEKPQEKTETKAPQVHDNSLEKVLHNIHKAIKSILLKAKSDNILTEQVTVKWIKKDDFNEITRLLQVLNNKDHIAKITSSSNEEIKALLESIQNFNKRLQIENDKFVIADTFGLPADEETTIENLKKLNIILDFFNQAIESLLPKLTKFLQEYEPEALKIAAQHEDEAKKALDHAKKVESMKRPIGNQSYQERSPYYGSVNDARPTQQGGGVNYNNQNQYNPNSYNQRSNNNQGNYNNSLDKNKNNSKENNPSNNSDKKADNKDQKKDDKKDIYSSIIDNLEGYFDSYTNEDFGSFKTTINKAGEIFSPFKTADEKLKSKAEKILEKQELRTPLSIDDSILLEKYKAQQAALNKNFAKSTQAAHAYYSDMQDSIMSLSPLIDDIVKVVNTVRSAIEKMTLKDLEKLQNSSSLKKLEKQIDSYNQDFKNMQKNLKEKFQMHKLERDSAYEISAYNELASKINSMYGLDKKISDAKSQIESLRKAIKGAIARQKRQANKSAQ